MPGLARLSLLSSPIARSVAVCLGLALAVGCSRKDEDPEASDAALALAPPIVAPGPSRPAAAAPVRDARAEEERRAGWVDAGRFCGDEKLLPDCPMQGWMKRYATPAVSEGDIAALGAVFDRIRAMDPTEPGDPRPYANWGSISQDGADAARAGEVEAAKAACRGCHVQYLGRYKASYRGRPLPAGAQ